MSGHVVERTASGEREPCEGGEGGEGVRGEGGESPALSPLAPTRFLAVSSSSSHKSISFTPGFNQRWMNLRVCL